MNLSKSDVEHLRRLLGWMRCDYGVFQSPEEIRETWKDLADHGVIPDAHNGSRERLMQHYNLSADVPKYIRHGLKMLTAALREHDEKMATGAIVEGHIEDGTVARAAVRAIEDKSKFIEAMKTKP